MARAQVCQPQFPGRQQGRRPAGKGRVKSAFQLPGKKGGGGGEREEEKQTRSVCRRHKARYTKGPERGEGGRPGHGSSPHLRGGRGKNADGTFLRGGQRGSLPQTRWVRSSAAGLAAGVGQGGPGPQRARRPPVFPVNCPPTPRPPRRSLRLPRTRGGGTPLARATPERTTCGFHPPSRCTGRAPGGSYLSPEPGPAPAPLLPPPRSLQHPRSPPGTARRPRTAASKPEVGGRGGRGGSRETP